MFGWTRGFGKGGYVQSKANFDEVLKLTNTVLRLRKEIKDSKKEAEEKKEEEENSSQKEKYKIKTIVGESGDIIFHLFKWKFQNRQHGYDTSGWKWVFITEHPEIQILEGLLDIITGEDVKFYDKTGDFLKKENSISGTL